MMQDIALQSIPSQKLSFQFEDETYTIRIKSTDKATSINIVRGEEAIVNDARLIPLSPVIKYDYKRTTGDFILQTENKEIADYTKFGVSQFLVYATLEELG